MAPRGVRALSRGGPARDRRLPVDTKRRGRRVDRAAARARGGPVEGTVPRLLRLRDRPGIRALRISGPRAAASVRPAHCFSQTDRIAQVHHVVRGRVQSHGTAGADRITRDDRRRTVRVLVTGATGFTGGHLARALASRSVEVRALVRDPASPAAGDLAKAGIAVIPGDLRDATALTTAAAGVDVVYHIAAMYRQAGLPASVYRHVN